VNNYLPRLSYWFLGVGVVIIGIVIIISNIIPLIKPQPEQQEVIQEKEKNPVTPPTNPNGIAINNFDNNTNNKNNSIWPVILTIGGGSLLTVWVFWNIIKSRNRPQETLFKPVLIIHEIDELQIAKTVRQSSRKTKPGFSDRIVITTGYYPVTRRQMKQSWRYLRSLVREGPRTELDIEATVNQIGRQGLLLEPVFISPRVNRTELLLLIDQGGSMIPFHRLSHRLTETALQAGRWGKTTIYYFHNCPVDYLYHDRDHLEAESITMIFSQLPVQWTVVLMFSDGGAARGGLNPQRIELTKAFLGQLKQQVRAMAWLNPMPCNRWNGTTAGEIRPLVPMFEFSREGLQNAINVLRVR
ncbi:MAG: VWA domain-containing protein, partial [Moorea sp. SIO4E2]